MHPLHEFDSESFYQQFFRPEFFSERLGTRGRWQGSAVASSGLKNPVRAEDLAKLFQGWTPEGGRLVRGPLAGNPVRAWRFGLVADPGASTLWAMADKFFQQRIRFAHNRAVHVAVLDFERNLNWSLWHDNSPQAPKRRMTLFAKFQSGASREQAPQLQSNLILFNFVVQSDGKMSSFTPDQADRMEQRMLWAYKRNLEFQFNACMFGRVRLPDELCQRFQDRSNFGVLATNSWAGERVLKGEALLACWREQGRSWGWGPEQLDKAHREEARRLTWSKLMVEHERFVRGTAWWIHDRVVGAKRNVTLPEKQPQANTPQPVEKVPHEKTITQSHSH